MGEPTPEAWEAVRAVCDEALGAGQGFKWFERRLGQQAGIHRWCAWGEGQDFNRRALALYKAWLSIDYAHKRLQQLLDADFALWIYRQHDPLADCYEAHGAFDGITLHREHPFWDVWYPPNGYGCTCHVGGARSESGAARVGGHAEKNLPSWWDDPAKGPNPVFVGFQRPDLYQIVRAVLSDEAL